jgi:hypothetical protein
MLMTWSHILVNKLLHKFSKKKEKKKKKKINSFLNNDDFCMVFKHLPSFSDNHIGFSICSK